MAKILCRTKGNANPKGKPRVYFTCHPEDFDRYFNKLCEDIFKTHDCAIFYTEDMNAVIEEQDKATDLESNNLFIVPVTFRLLTQPNRAMDADIPYAFEKHIPVLPFMMVQEILLSEIEKYYSAKFGELQYLKVRSLDQSEIAYGEKLKHYLDDKLSNQQWIKQVRSAFHAYIFLSYRKKDRRYANELMRLIHSHPECRDIAIWYDEFLTPGENFRQNIEEILTDCKLFTLLVTPNLLEEADGRPNFVMGEEYPAAKKLGIDILPVEMEETDNNELSKKFEGIPSCVKPDDESFKVRLMEYISKIAPAKNNDDPMHNFLIGLAYLDGIDVEVDRQRGLELITFAADADLPEAMEKLYHVYYSNDPEKATFWAGRLVQYYRKQYGEKHSSTLLWMNYQALATDDVPARIELAEKLYAIHCDLNGEDHPRTIAILEILAFAYSCSNYVFGSPKALKAYKRVYVFQKQKFGEESAATLTALDHLANAYAKWRDFQQALSCYKEGDFLPCGMVSADLYRLATEYETCGDCRDPLPFYEKIYTLRVKLLGNEHEDTLRALRFLAYEYSFRGAHNKALDLLKKEYDIRSKRLGDEDPSTMEVLVHLHSQYVQLGDNHNAIKSAEKLYFCRCKAFGEEAYNTTWTLTLFFDTYKKFDYYSQAFEIAEKILSSKSDFLLKNPDYPIRTLKEMFVMCQNTKNAQDKGALLKKLYELCCDTLGLEHEFTVSVLSDLESILVEDKDYRKALDAVKQIYKLKRNCLGKEHPQTLTSRNNLGILYLTLASYAKATEYLEGAYAARCKVLGPQHPDTLETLEVLKILYQTRNVCQYCGNKFKGLFRKKCSNCGKAKDY